MIIQIQATNLEGSLYSHRMCKIQSKINEATEPQFANIFISRSFHMIELSSSLWPLPVNVH